MASFPAGFSITGGFPIKSQDFAASIIFLALYAVLIPLGVWRMVNRETRTTILIRPLIFIVARIATWIMRVMQADQTEISTGLLTGEQILLLTGFVLLCEPLLSLLGYHVKRNSLPGAHNGTILHRVLRLLKLTLMAALVLGIVAGSSISSALNDPSKLSTLRTLRDANAIICLVITILVPVVALAARMNDSTLPARPTFDLVAIGLFLSIASAFKLYSYLRTPALSPISAGAKAAFYILSAVPEWLVTSLYLSINLNFAFDIEEGKRREKAEKAMKKNGGRAAASDEMVLNEVHQRGADGQGFEDARYFEAAKV